MISFDRLTGFWSLLRTFCLSQLKEREVTILDFGWEALSDFAMYYYLHEKKGYDVNIIGLDLKQDVIIHCNKLAKKYGYEKSHFFIGDIVSYEGVDQVDMVVTLHACDTPVAYCPVFVFLGFSAIFSTSNKISPTCFGDEILKGVPARV